jgi:hypothetical protein
MPSAYDLVKNWRQYHQATQAGRAGIDVPFSTFGVMGTPGFSSGAFLKSPFCDSKDPDIQLTFFPSVSSVVIILIILTMLIIIIIIIIIIILIIMLIILFFIIFPTDNVLYFPDCVCSRLSPIWKKQGKKPHRAPTLKCSSKLL